jgi:hypothetical protein
MFIEKWSGQLLDLIMMSHLLDDVWIRIRDISVVLLLSLFLIGESCLFVSWCAEDKCDMTDSDKDRGRSRWTSIDDWRWSHIWILTDLMIGMSDDTIYGLHRTHEDKKHEFLD